MRVPRKLGSFAAAMACINLLMPLHLLHATDPPKTSTASPATFGTKIAKPITRDITLSRTHELRGKVVDKNGKLVANRIVVAVHADKSSLETVSDANGNFRFSQVKPGTYQIASERSYQICRCWAANTQPPVASPQLLMVEGDLIVRGQRPIGELLSGPILIGLIIAAAIIIPIAVHNSQKSAS